MGFDVSKVFSGSSCALGPSSASRFAISAKRFFSSSATRFFSASRLAISARRFFSSSAVMVGVIFWV